MVYTHMLVCIKCISLLYQLKKSKRNGPPVVTSNLVPRSWFLNTISNDTNQGFPGKYQLLRLGQEICKMSL